MALIQLKGMIRACFFVLMFFAGGHSERFESSPQPNVLTATTSSDLIVLDPLRLSSIIFKEIKPGSFEDDNYERISKTKLAQFVPKYYGQIKHNNKPYVMIENLLDGFVMSETNIIDIKISYIKNPPLCYAYPNNFRIVGCVIDNETIKVNKTADFFSTLHYMEDHIGKHTHHLKSIINDIKKMMTIITNKDKLYSSSLFVAVSPSKYIVKIIDLTDYESELYPLRADVDVERYDIEQGLKNICQYYQYLYFKNFEKESVVC